MIRRRDIFLSSEMLCQQLVVLKVNDHVKYQLTPCITIYSLLLLIKHVLAYVMTEPSGGPIMAEKNYVGCLQ